MIWMIARSPCRFLLGKGRVSGGTIGFIHVQLLPIAVLLVRISCVYSGPHNEKERLANYVNKSPPPPPPPPRAQLLLHKEVPNKGTVRLLWFEYIACSVAVAIA